ncbi:MAG: UDP-N-acetylglucosamine--N-acetylmuramyl-(pentapeptide) pyrophosphoryl-undecaprenol N-acetylglucosamine transferase [Clostridia bacterium]|nr:UDP-N-acetylglucosamine--N-acetylmuramyl-(pentapeptide) pyrophosphoryl-undecaprenol N-acetylglucosamine transferase [Clostridia bacterium]
MTNIVLVGGGTAGHIMPNIALVPALEKLFDRVLYIGTPNSMEERICKMRNIQFYPTKATKFYRRKIWKNALLPFTLAQGISRAKKILKEEKVSLVFSKGGYAALPTVLAARLLGIPIVCHESDRSMGLANRITAPISERVYTAFPKTYRKARVIATPIREEIFEGKKLDYFSDNERKTVLFMGGSLGAKAINDALSECYAALSNKYNILHITGKGGMPIRTPCYVALPYADNIADLFRSADLVVSRGGASTLGELTALGKRVLVIPLPKGESRGDQEENAAYYRSKGLVSVIPQSALNAETLEKVIDDIILKRPPAPAYDRDTPATLAKELYDIARMRHFPLPANGKK